jgi:hypothetical protein
MRKSVVFGLAVVAAVMLGAGSLYAQPMGPGYGPQQQQGWGPGYGMGPGMMGPGYGYGMGPGMMGQGGGWGPGYGPQQQQGWGPGYGMGPGMMGPGYGYGMMGPGYGYGPQSQQPAKPLEKSDVETMVKNYLASTRNPNLKLGKIEDKGNTFEADIVTKDNALVDKILVDKTTGWMRSAY